MAVAEQAALLDELMGKGRNASLGEARNPHWSDDGNCKFFLAGLCPHELFNNTKDDIGPCEKVHDDKLLQKYRKSDRKGTMRYEENLCTYLKDLLSTVESRIRRGESRLKRNGTMVHSSYNCEREGVLDELTSKIEDALCKVEKLGTEGEVEQSRVWLDVAEQLKIEKSRMEKSIEIYNQQAKELEICQTCGAFQVKGDAYQRIEEHLQGKMHLGYAQIREFLTAYAEEKERITKEEKWNRSQLVELNKSKKVEDNIKEKTKEKYRDNEKTSEKYRDKDRKRKRSASIERHQSTKHSRKSNDRDRYSSNYTESKRISKSFQKSLSRR